jgi:hypothetical protein
MTTGYTPRKGDSLTTQQGESLVVVDVGGGMVNFKGTTTTGRINISTWTGMWRDATDRHRGPV